ncbi:hypothetical protein N7G274_009497 [Stereocaulon virgatum]|uniref:Uncharacterized protein n=1 Tax=Stereocaulon virgatum TaxID=373712 RepID=A0ABR4A0C0_9LECA
MVGFFSSLQKKLSKTIDSLRTVTTKRNQVNAKDERGTDSELTSLLPFLTDDVVDDEADLYGVMPTEIPDDMILPPTIPYPEIFEHEMSEADAVRLAHDLKNACDIEMTEAEAAQLEQNLKRAYYETFHSATGLCEYCGDHQTKLHDSPIDSGASWNDEVQDVGAGAECFFDFDTVAAEIRLEMCYRDDQPALELVEEPGMWDFGPQEAIVWSPVK